MGDAWTPDQSVASLPKEIRIHYKREATRLLNDLHERKLRIGTQPAPKRHYGPNHKIRAVTATNPLWYQDLYRSMNKRKKHKGYTKGFTRRRSGKGLHTICERSRVESALSQIARGLDYPLGASRRHSGPNHAYQAQLRNLIHTHLLNGFYEDEDHAGAPNNDVRTYFGMEPLDLEEYWSELYGYTVAG